MRLPRIPRLLPLLSLLAAPAASSSAFLRSTSRHGATSSAEGTLEAPGGKAPPAKYVPLEFDLTEGNRAAEGDGFGHVGSSGIAVATLLIQDSKTHPEWGNSSVYPEWAAKVLAATAKHSGKYDHTYVVRRNITLPIPEYESRLFPPGQAFKDSANWEKFGFILDYLETGRFSHMLLMDADATFFNPAHDTARALADQMDKQNASLLLADEDWQGQSGLDNVNGGVQMWRNTTYAKVLLRSLIAGHQDPKGTKWGCWKNEQMCLRGFLKDSLKGEAQRKPFPLDEHGKSRLDHVVIVSGMRYNRHICAVPKAFGGADGKCMMEYTPEKLAALKREQELDKEQGGNRWFGFQANATSECDIVHFMGGGKPKVTSPVFAAMER